MKISTRLVAGLLTAGLLQAASALTVVGNSIVTYATEILPGNPVITINPLGFNSTSQSVVSGNGLSIRVTLSSGTFAACGAFSQIDTNNMAINAGWTSSGAGTATCTYSNIAANVGTSTTAANTFFRLQGGTAQGFNLVTLGVNDDGCGFTTGTLTVKAQYFDASGVEVDLPTAGGNAPSGMLNEAIVARAAQAITGVTTQHSTAGILDIRNLGGAASVPGSQFVYQRANGTYVNSTSTFLGTVQFVNTEGVQASADAVTDYLQSNAGSGTWTGVFTASKPFPVGSRVFMMNNNVANSGCEDPDATKGIPGVTVATSLFIPGVLSNTSQSLEGSAITVKFHPGRATPFTQGNFPMRVCLEVPGNATVPEMNIRLHSRIDRTTAGRAPDFSAGAACPVAFNKITYNGGLIEVRNYVPLSQKGLGWEGFLRVINAGVVDTSLTAYYVGEDGTATTPKTLLANLSARANVTLTSATVEAAIGSPPASVSNPRLMISAPTNALRVQNYIRQPTGNWSEWSSGQDDGSNASGSSR